MEPVVSSADGLCLLKTRRTSVLLRTVCQCVHAYATVTNPTATIMHLVQAVLAKLRSRGHTRPVFLFLLQAAELKEMILIVI